MHPLNAEIDERGERAFFRAVAEDAQRVARHSAVVPGAFDAVVERAVFVHQLNRMLKVAVFLFQVFEGAPPERAFFFVAAAER